MNEPIPGDSAEIPTKMAKGLRYYMNLVDKPTVYFGMADPILHGLHCG